MAKTIGQLPPLPAVPDDTDELMIADSGVAKKITAANLKGDCLRTISDVIAVPDADDISFGTTTGTKLGTAVTQKIGFWNAAPVVQPLLTADLLDSLQAVGLVSAGAGDTPLDLSSGAVACGDVACGSVTLADAKDLVVGTTTGTKLGTSPAQKIGFFNATPVVQPTAIANATTAATAITQLNALLGKLRTLGIIAT